jgi:hypothetical protein
MMMLWELIQLLKMLLKIKLVKLLIKPKLHKIQQL